MECHWELMTAQSHDHMEDHMTCHTNNNYAATEMSRRRQYIAAQSHDHMKDHMTCHTNNNYAATEMSLRRRYIAAQSHDHIEDHMTSHTTVTDVIFNHLLIQTYVLTMFILLNEFSNKKLLLVNMCMRFKGQDIWNKVMA